MLQTPTQQSDVWKIYNPTHWFRRTEELCLLALTKTHSECHVGKTSSTTREGLTSGLYFQPHSSPAISLRKGFRHRRRATKTRLFSLSFLAHHHKADRICLIVNWNKTDVAKVSRRHRQADGFMMVWPISGNPFVLWVVIYN